MTEEQKRQRNQKLYEEFQHQCARRIERAPRAAKNPSAVLHELTLERMRQISNLH